MNPILRKELRSLLREPRGWIVPGLYATALSAAIYTAGASAGATVGTEWFPEHDATSFGNAAASTVFWTQSVAVALLAPVLGGAAIASERERGTWTRLLAAPIARWRIGVGKLAAAWLYVLFLLMVSLPIFSVTVLYGGIDLPTLAGMYTMHLVLGLTLAALGVAISTAFHRTWVSAVVALAAGAAMVVFAHAGAAAVALTSRATGGWLELAMCCNPAYGVELFLGGDSMDGSTKLWWLHFGAMGGILSASSAFVLLRVRRMVS